jgi:pyrroline-5-carboxylate reductase
VIHINISVIGFGNLGRAFVSGLLSGGKVKTENITVCAKSDETLLMAEKEYGVKTESHLMQSVKAADLIVFSLKPAAFRQVNMADFPTEIPILSFMAGVTAEEIRNLTNTHSEVMRAMPNLAIEKCEGIIGYTHIQNRLVLDIIKSLGYVYETDEYGIDKLTAFSACGLGLAAYILNAYTEAGTALGLPTELCLEITKRTFISAAENGDYLKTISAVATKGGVTEQGVRYMAENRLDEIIRTAVLKAYEKIK